MNYRSLDYPDLISPGDEYFDAARNAWLPVTEASIGFSWSPRIFQPMRRPVEQPHACYLILMEHDC